MSSKFEQKCWEIVRNTTQDTEQSILKPAFFISKQQLQLDTLRLVTLPAEAESTGLVIALIP